MSNHQFASLCSTYKTWYKISPHRGLPAGKRVPFILAVATLTRKAIQPVSN